MEPSDFRTAHADLNARVQRGEFAPPQAPAAFDRGVAFTEPPTPILADATRIVSQLATDLLPPDAKGGVIGIATEKGWNAAVVHRAGDSFQVASWIGKSWGSGLTGGAAVRATW